MLRRVIGEDIVLTVTGKAATPHVRVDPGQVEQVATGTSRCRTNLAWARPSASYLPRSGAPLQAAVDPSVAKMPDGPEHILLVEDDTLATAPTSEML